MAIINRPVEGLFQMAGYQFLGLLSLRAALCHRIVCLPFRKERKPMIAAACIMQK